MPEPALRPWPWLWLVLIIHSASFFALSPQAWLVHDETFYVSQAATFAAGRTMSEVWDPDRQAFVPAVPSPYPPGTSLLMTGPVHVFGSSGARLVPWFGSIALVVGCAVWLELEGYSPLFALLTLTYLPTLVLSRLAMSDVPSAAMVAAALALFAVGTRRSRAWAMAAAGVLAGASLCLRESNPLLVLPLFTGAVLRRERFSWLPFAGLGLGAALRLLLASWLFGDVLFIKPLGTWFSLHDLLRHSPLYLIASLVFMPLGLVWVLRYRGPRRAEIIATVVGFLVLYASYEYAGEASGLAKSLILGPRYLIPLTPLFALCAAAAFAASAQRPALPRLLVIAACALPVLSAAGLHAYAMRQAPLQRALTAHVRSGDIVITDALASAKLLLSIGDVKMIELDAITDVRKLRALGRPVWIVIVDRDDSALWRELRHANAARVHALENQVHLQRVADVASADWHLRVWRVGD